MDCYDDTIKLDVFKYSTTYQSDYRSYCGHKKEVYRENSERSEPLTEIKPPPPIDDHESFARWREGVHIPFDLLLQPKPDVGKDPYKPFQKLVGYQDLIKSF